MRTLSVGIMAVTFVLGVGAVSVLFLVARVIVKLAQDRSINRIGFAI